jgi:SAM-dependent methyltransferase
MTGALAGSTALKISPRAQALLRSLCCHAPLASGAAHVSCTVCGAAYPVCDGIPVVLDEKSSVFRTEDFINRRATFFPKASRAKQLLRRLVPQISANIKAGRNLLTFTETLLNATPDPIVLVIGAGFAGHGFEVVQEQPAIDLVETDVSYGPRTALICDAHDLPFESDSFDGVIIQAVLEHVIDPVRAVREIHRVLKSRGIVYAEIPFMQGVHARQYDFTRFTHLGVRRLFRDFEEVGSGAACGPGMALAWSYEYFLLSFVRWRPARLFVTVFVRFTAFWLKYLDYVLIDAPGTLDGAAAYYFLGRKSTEALPDREILRLYRGAL